MQNVVVPEIVEEDYNTKNRGGSPKTSAVFRQLRCHNITITPEPRKTITNHDGHRRNDQFGKRKLLRRHLDGMM